MKKKNSVELLRLKTVIEKDRLKINECFSEVVKSDLTKLLNEYFDLKCDPELNIIKGKNNYVLEIKALAGSIKPFGVIPE